MTWREWYSRDTAWAIIRRGIIVAGIGCIAAISYKLLAIPKSDFFWFPCVGIPVVLTVLNLLDFLGTTRNKREENGVGHAPGPIEPKK